MQQEVNKIISFFHSYVPESDTQDDRSKRVEGAATVE